MRSPKAGRAWLALFGTWAAAWLVAVVSFSTLRWTSPTEPPTWPLQGPFNVALVVIWVAVPPWAGWLAAQRVGSSWWHRVLAGLGAVVLVALVDGALGTQLRESGGSDPDFLVLGLLVALSAGGIGVLAGLVERPVGAGAA